MGDLIAEVTERGRVYDLGLPLFQGMPHGPVHSPLLYSLTKLHGDVMYSGGVSTANDVFSMGTHVGTHVDALSHVSREGLIHGNRRVAPMQTLSGGIEEMSIDFTGPIVTRGVLLDMPRVLQVDTLDGSHELSADMLELAAQTQRTSIRNGDTVLIRTGWTRYWPNAVLYNSHPAPGPNLDGAHWLASRGAAFTGSDTPAYEKTPARGLAVHVALMVEAGIQIMEMLDLERLAQDGVYEFLFIALPLKLRGATASPVRPIAIAQSWR